MKVPPSGLATRRGDFFAALLVIDTRRTAARNWVGLRAPHLRKKPPLCKGRWHGFAVTEGLYLAATPKPISLRCRV